MKHAIRGGEGGSGEKTLGTRLREPWDFLSKNMQSWDILRPILGFLRNSIWQLWTGSSNSLLWWTGGGHSWKDHPKLGVCKQIILWGFWKRFRMQPICFFRQLQTWILLNYFVSFTVCFYCCQRRPYWREASEQRRGKLCHSISIQSGRPWSCIFRNWPRFGSYNVYPYNTRISYI